VLGFGRIELQGDAATCFHASPIEQFQIGYSQRTRFPSEVQSFFLVAGRFSSPGRSAGEVSCVIDRIGAAPRGSQLNLEEIELPGVGGQVGRGELDLPTFPAWDDIGAISRWSQGAAISQALPASGSVRRSLQIFERRLLL